MPKVTVQQFVAFLGVFPSNLEKLALEAAEANAQLTGSRVREHVVKDDLPLTALSPSWIKFKLAHGYKQNHLWYTGQYLANFGVQPVPHGFEVGTNRPAKGFPSGGWKNLPELLEHHYPVWQLTLDELEPIIKTNWLEALDAAANQRTPAFRNQ